MASKNAKKDQTTVQYLDNDFLLSATHAWTYLRLNNVQAHFLSELEQEAESLGFTGALSNLVSGPNAVDCHLRIVTRPFNTDAWEEQLFKKVAGQNPTSGWAAYAENMASQVHGFEEKISYLGVCLGSRTQASGVSDVFAPVRWFSRLFGRLAGDSVDLVVHDEELDMWRTKARSVHATLAESAVPATANEIAWVIKHTMWPGMETPDATSTGSTRWGDGETRSLVEGVLIADRHHIEVEQVSPETSQVERGFQISLAFSKFQDSFSFDSNPGWIGLMSQFPFPVEFSSRMSIVPAVLVQKEVRKRLADAKDQGEHMASAGTAVSISVQEQLHMATIVEYQLGKSDRPWIYARHRLLVMGATAIEVAANAKLVKEKYKSVFGIDLVAPTGDQREMLLESMPGDRCRTDSYLQRQEIELLFGGMPTATNEVGDRLENGQGWTGPYIGYTRRAPFSPVFFSPQLAPALDKASVVSITGSPGGGKSFLAFTLAYQMAVQGVWTIYIDPKADAKPIGSIPGLGKPNVIDLKHGAPGLLDPFGLAPDAPGQTVLAIETLRLLLGNVTPAETSAIYKALDATIDDPNPSLRRLMDFLLSAEGLDANNVGARLKTLSKLDFASLCFSPDRVSPIRPEDGLTIITLLGLEIPDANIPESQYSIDMRLALTVMYLLTSFTTSLMISDHTSHQKAILIDEAWAIMSTPQGAAMISKVARMGRSLNTALVLVSQNAGDILMPGAENAITSKFAFGTKVRREQDDVIQMMNLDDNSGFQSVLGSLKKGQCLYQDVSGRTSVTQIHSWDPQLHAAFDTNPETRGKNSSTNGNDED